MFVVLFVFLIVSVILIKNYLIEQIGDTIGESYTNTKKPCKKWEGINMKNSPNNICKDCGYPIDCHGPFRGESWRHPFLFN